MSERKNKRNIGLVINNEVKYTPIKHDERFERDLLALYMASFRLGACFGFSAKIRPKMKLRDLIKWMQSAEGEAMIKSILKEGGL